MLVLLVTFAVTVAAAPLVRRILLQRGVIDIPNHRSSHATPVPRGGGIACVAGVLVGLGVADSLHGEVPWLAVAGALVLAGVGYADDRWALGAVLRLGVQIVVGALIGSTAGGGGWILAGAILVPVVVNAVNFMDGINGITSLNMAMWGALAMIVGYRGRDVALEVVGAVTVGSALGFLPWNAPVARLFLGDVGSYFFGAFVAIGIVTGSHLPSEPLLLIAPLSIYLVDTGASLVRRALRGESLTTAHREHVYQRLVNENGFSHLPVAAATAFLSLVITVAWASGSLLLAGPVTLVVLATYLASPRVLARVVARGRDSAEGTVDR